ncbi:MAG: adenylate cyclase regulatory domain-containing protein [Thermoleophilaceae bacterium]
MGDAARQEVLERLRDARQDRKTLERAESEGRLASLPVELALGGPGKYTLTQVARDARIDPRFLRKLMQAHGRPDPAPRERVYTDDDLEYARLIRGFLDAGIPRDGILEIARVLGQGMANTADVVRQMIADLLLEPGDSEFTLGLRYADVAEQLAPEMGTLLDYLFRAQLREGVQRQLLSEEERQAGEIAGSQEVAVAFADLVGYTKLGGRLPTEDVGRIASRLAELAGSATHPPVQLVKTIGDAAMFVSPEVPALLETLIALVAAVKKEGEEFPAVSVGVAHGPATSRGGDWFGATVNVASRITDAAGPGQVLATEEVVAAAGKRKKWKKKRRRSLKGIDGRVRLFSLELPGS